MNMFGIDLGTNCIKLFSKSTNQVYSEKNTIAIKNKKEIFAIGDEAYAMYEKAPSIIQVSFPVINGVIADFNNMQHLVEAILQKYTKGNLKNVEFVVAVPTDITEVEKRSFYEIFVKSKFKPKNVLLCEKPIASAVGLGLNVKEPTGIMVVDIGADTSEISVISLGGLVLSDLLRVGGNHLDEAIVTHIKRKYSLVIGKKTASQLKIELGSAINEDYGKSVVVGRDVVSGLPVEMEISSADVNEAIVENLNSLGTSIKLILEKTPPELARDIIHSGIYLCGGTSMLKDIDKLIFKLTNIKVNLSDSAEDCVVKGLDTIVTNKSLSDLAYNFNRKIYS